MVRNNSSAEAKNSLLQLSNWGQVSNNDREAIDTGVDSTASDESGHAAAQSIITQVSMPARDLYSIEKLMISSRSLSLIFTGIRSHQSRATIPATLHNPTHYFTHDEVNVWMCRSTAAAISLQ